MAINYPKVLNRLFANKQLELGLERDANLGLNWLKVQERNLPQVLQALGLKPSDVPSSSMEEPSLAGEAQPSQAYKMTSVQNHLVISALNRVRPESEKGDYPTTGNEPARADVQFITWKAFDSELNCVRSGGIRDPDQVPEALRGFGVQGEQELNAWTAKVKAGRVPAEHGATMEQVGAGMAGAAGWQLQTEEQGTVRLAHESGLHMLVTEDANLEWRVALTDGKNEFNVPLQPGQELPSALYLGRRIADDYHHSVSAMNLDLRAATSVDQLSQNLHSQGLPLDVASLISLSASSDEDVPPAYYLSRVDKAGVAQVYWAEQSEAGLQLSMSLDYTHTGASLMEGGLPILPTPHKSIASAADMLAEYMPFTWAFKDTESDYGTSILSGIPDVNKAAQFMGTSALFDYAVELTFDPAASQKVNYLVLLSDKEGVPVFPARAGWSSAGDASFKEKAPAIKALSELYHSGAFPEDAFMGAACLAASGKKFEEAYEYGASQAMKSMLGGEPAVLSVNKLSRDGTSGYWTAATAKGQDVTKAFSQLLKLPLTEGQMALDANELETAQVTYARVLAGATGAIPGARFSIDSASVTLAQEEFAAKEARREDRLKAEAARVPRAKKPKDLGR